MKSILVIATLIASTLTTANAFANDNYTFDPFNRQVWEWGAQRPRNFEVFAARLEKVTTKGIKVEYACGSEGDMVCYDIQPTEQVEAIKVEVTYYNAGSSSDDASAEKTIYLRTDSLTAAAKEALSAGKRLTGGKVRALFGVAATPVTTREEVIDYGKSAFCEDSPTPYCKDQIVYKMADITRIHLSIIPRQ